jgi:hypothetical protein
MVFLEVILEKNGITQWNLPDGPIPLTLDGNLDKQIGTANPFIDDEGNLKAYCTVENSYRHQVCNEYGNLWNGLCIGYSDTPKFRQVSTDDSKLVESVLRTVDINYDTED